MLPPFWWKRYWITTMSESLRIFFASVRQTSRIMAQQTNCSSAFLIWFHSSALVWHSNGLPLKITDKIELFLQLGEMSPMLKGSGHIMLFDTVAWWENLNIGVLWAAHISALMQHRCEVCSRVCWPVGEQVCMCVFVWLSCSDRNHTVCSLRTCLAHWGSSTGHGRHEIT